MTRSNKHVFIDYLNQYGTDFSYIRKIKNFSDLSDEVLTNLYTEHLAEKGDFVHPTGEESCLSFLHKIFKKKEDESNYYCDADTTDSVNKKDIKLDVRDYRLPFLLKDREYYLKQQLTYIWELYGMMIKEGVVDHAFIDGDWIRRHNRNILTAISAASGNGGATSSSEVMADSSKVVEGGKKDDSSILDANVNNEDVVGRPVANAIVDDKMARCLGEDEVKDNQSVAGDCITETNPADVVKAKNDKRTAMAVEGSANADFFDSSVLAFEKFHQKMRAVISKNANSAMAKPKVMVDLGVEADLLREEEPESAEMKNGSFIGDDKPDLSKTEENECNVERKNSDDVIKTANNKSEANPKLSISLSRARLNINKTSKNSSNSSFIEMSQPEVETSVKRIKMNDSGLDLLNDDILLESIHKPEVEPGMEHVAVDSTTNKIEGKALGNVNVETEDGEGQSDDKKEAKDRSLSEYLSVSRFLKKFK